MFVYTSNTSKKNITVFFPSLYFMFFRGGKKTIHFNHVCSMTSQQVITHMASHDRLAHNSLKWDIFDNTRTIINTTSGCMCGKEAQRELARGDKIIVLVKQLAIYLSIYLSLSSLKQWHRHLSSSHLPSLTSPSG
jgi:hypothetical protein